MSKKEKKKLLIIQIKYFKIISNEYKTISIKKLHIEIIIPSMKIRLELLQTKTKNNRFLSKKCRTIVDLLKKKINRNHQQHAEISKMTMNCADSK